jgi:hypothetical protein
MSAVTQILGNDTTTAATNANPFPVIHKPADLAVTASANATAFMLTLPAAGSGTFHYVMSIELSLYSTAARAGVATPITVTSTNLPGAPSWDFDTAGAIGTTNRIILTPSNPIKSSVANMATTILCPAVTGGIFRVAVRYAIGA